MPKKLVRALIQNGAEIARMEILEDAWTIILDVAETAIPNIRQLMQEVNAEGLYGNTMEESPSSGVIRHRIVQRYNWNARKLDLEAIVRNWVTDKSDYPQWKEICPEVEGQPWQEKKVIVTCPYCQQNHDHWEWDATEGDGIVTARCGEGNYKLNLVTEIEPVQICRGTSTTTHRLVKTPEKGYPKIKL